MPFLRAVKSHHLRKKRQPAHQITLDQWNLVFIPVALAVTDQQHANILTLAFGHKAKEFQPRFLDRIAVQIEQRLN